MSIQEPTVVPAEQVPRELRDRYEAPPEPPLWTGARFRELLEDAGPGRWTAEAYAEAVGILGAAAGFQLEGEPVFAHLHRGAFTVETRLRVTPLAGR